MTKDEIKSLIATKIAGQGTQVDLGNALPTILNEIVDQLGGGDTGIVDLSTLEKSDPDYVVPDDFAAIALRDSSGRLLMGTKVYPESINNVEWKDYHATSGEVLAYYGGLTFTGTSLEGASGFKYVRIRRGETWTKELLAFEI